MPTRTRWASPARSIPWNRRSTASCSAPNSIRFPNRNKAIHPFSDFLLHDVGTGDGVVQNGGQATRNRLRTVPLWGLRTRGRFMHDALSMSVESAILRHGGQATSVRQAYEALSSQNKTRLLAFLDSL
jgi:CxxC motif-containing protein (DUF1111 family)